MTSGLFGSHVLSRDVIDKVVKGVAPGEAGEMAIREDSGRLLPTALFAQWVRASDAR